MANPTGNSYQRISTSGPADHRPTEHNQTVALPSGSSRPKGKLPNRTTKTSHKLALFPDTQEEPLEEVEDEVYNQITQLPQGTARREAERVKRLDRSSLPRVTAYCTAAGYRLDDVQRYLHTMRSKRGTHPRRFDECIHTPFSYAPGKITPRSPTAPHQLIDVGSPTAVPSSENAGNGRFTNGEGEGEGEVPEGGALEEIVGELFVFDYGVVVIWGLSEVEEQRVLDELSGFKDDQLAKDDIETEEFHFHYNTSYQPRIYNDIITLRQPRNYMIKLTISHAIAQSTKLALFEGLVEERIEKTKHIPQEMARTGKVIMTRGEIAKNIGQLFIMRINVNLVSNVLDTPEIFWSEPQLQPLYQAIRGYLEITQRADIINQRVSVIGEMLEMLKDHLNYSHSEKLEWIIIYVITFEAIIGIITVGFDWYNLYH